MITVNPDGKIMVRRCLVTLRPFRLFVLGIGFFTVCFLMTSLGGQFSARRLGDSPFTIRTEVLGGPESRGVLRKMSDLLELMVKRMDTLARLENSSGLHPEAGDPHAAAHRPGLSPVPCAALRLLQGGRVPPGWGSACHLLLSPGEEPPSIMPRGAHQPAGRAVNPGTLRLQDWGCVCQGLREAAPLSLCPSPGAQTRPPPALPRSTPGGILRKHPPDSASSHPHPDPLPGNYRGS